MDRDLEFLRTLKIEDLPKGPVGGFGPGNLVVLRKGPIDRIYKINEMNRSKRGWLLTCMVLGTRVTAWISAIKVRKATEAEVATWVARRLGGTQ